MRRKILVAAAAVAAAFLSGAGMASDIYRYVDADGIEHFTDVPDSPRYRLMLPGAGIPSRPKEPAAYAEAIRRHAAAMKLDPLLLDAVIQVESGHNPNALSARGAAGLMQLMPATARRYGVSDPFQPDANIRGGAQYLRDLTRMFDGDLRLTLAAYNAGEGAVLRHGQRVPPYAETRRYVSEVLRSYAELSRKR